MSEWVYKVAAAAIVLTVCTLLLPSGTVKKTALTAFGFIFLLAVVSPVQDIIAKGILKLSDFKMEINLARAELEESIDADGSYEAQVMDRYILRLEEETQRTVNEIPGLLCASASVVVERDSASDTFAIVQRVYCSVAFGQKQEQAEDDRLIKPVDTVDKIIISSGGISIGNASDTEEDGHTSGTLTETQKQLLAEASEAICRLLNITADQIEFIL